jgi:hypothetical protein
MRRAATRREFATFADFYPHYLRQHAHASCRRLHFVGTTLVAIGLLAAAWLGEPWLAPAAIAVGYGFAWVGHFFFEHNRPATFSHPLYSIAGDWVMYRDMLTGRIRW